MTKETDIVIHTGPDAPPIEQALAALAGQCERLAGMAPDRQNDLARLIDQFHGTLIDPSGPLWRRGSV